MTGGPHQPDRSQSVTDSPRSGFIVDLTATTSPALTPFDQQVLGILIGCGGWNSISRSRLVALASEYGVSVDGLIKVVTGLSQYAGSGGPRLEVAQITAQSTYLQAESPPPSAASHTTIALAERWTPELRRQSYWATVKLIMLFGAVTILFGVISLQLLLPQAETTVSPPASPSEVEYSGRSLPPVVTTPTPELPGSRLAVFPVFPTFQGNSLPIDAADAADECPQLPALFSELARKLSLTDDPSEAVFRDWEYAVNTASIGWVLADQSTRYALKRGAEEVMFAASDMPQVSDRLLIQLNPPELRRLDTLDLWRGSWKVNMLAHLDQSTLLPPMVIEAARRQIESILNISSSKFQDEHSHAQEWLDKAIDRLVEVTEYDPNIYDLWEMWLFAQREVSDGHVSQNSLMRAIEAILRTNVDLSNPGPSVNVLGRLLNLVDFNQDVLVKQQVMMFFTSHELIATHDLWVLTSLLAQSDMTDWFDETMVLPADGNYAFRNRIRDAMEDHWPEIIEHVVVDVSAELPQMNIDLVQQWLALYARLTTELPDSHLQLTAVLHLNSLLSLSHLNAAALALAYQQDEQAQQIMQSLPQLTADRRDDMTQRLAHQRNRQPSGSDGRWTEEYDQVRRSTNEKIQLLQKLRSGVRTDLGPIDTVTFVREVYRGSSREIRALASTVLIERLSQGANVALEMLDQFPDAPLSDELSDLIYRFTGHILPPSGGETWIRETRIALTRHALELYQGGSHHSEVLTEQLTDSYLARLDIISNSLSTTTVIDTPDEAAHQLAETWYMRISLLGASHSIPADLSALTQRRAIRQRLAEDPLQDFVVAQLTILDYLAYQTAAHFPGVVPSLTRQYNLSVQQRQQYTHVLSQAVRVEHDIASLWQLRWQYLIDQESQEPQP